MKKSAKLGCVAAAVILWTTGLAGSVFAHCDTLDGPVVNLARQALAKGDVKIVLPWAAADQEAEIRKAFDLAMADRYFFETLVRVHREGEGAPFTGLKPAGLDLGPAIPAADKALESDDPGLLLKLINEEVRQGIHKYYMEAKEKKAHAGESVEAGRAYVAAYVPYLHFVERLDLDASTPVAHGGEAGTHDARLKPGAAAEQKRR